MDFLGSDDLNWLAIKLAKEEVDDVADAEASANSSLFSSGEFLLITIGGR